MAAAAPARLLASPEIRALLQRRLAELGGLALGLGGVALMVALVCYNPLDPSLNTATSRVGTNLAGPVGSIAADLLLQSFGVAGALPSLAMLAWAWRIASHRGLGSFAARLAATGVALPVVATVAAALPVSGAVHWPAESGPGGAIGSVLWHALAGWGQGMLGPFGAAGFAMVFAALSLLLIWASLGLSAGEWRAAGRVARGSVVHSGRAGRRAAGLLPRLAALVRGRAATEEGVSDAVAERRMAEPRRAEQQRADDPRAEPKLRRARPDREPDRMPDAPFPDARPAPRTIAPAPDTGIDLPRLSTFREDTRRPEPRTLEPRSPEPRLPEPVKLRGDTPVALPPPPVMPAASPLAAPAPASPPLAKISNAVRKIATRQDALPLAEPSANGWRMPPLALLKAAPPRASVGPSEESLQANARLLESVLSEYGVEGIIRDIRPGPVVTLYELEPAPGIRSARVIGLADDVARSLSVTAVRIATVPGRNVIGIEVPNAKRETVYLSELLGSEAWDKHPARLAIAIGKDIGGEPILADLARMPHLLVAGTTGSGKSVGINAMILSLLYRLSPDQCRLILIDPKMLELSVYDGIPHLMAPVVTEPAKAVTALKWTVREMERRYRAMSQLGVRNVGGYNDRVEEAQARGEVVTRRVQTGFDAETGKPMFEEHPLALEKLPFLVVIIDEMADLMMVAGKEIEATVQRLAQMARAAGIHVVMATQRPSVDVITGTIKANFPTRISFTVISKFDSRTILGEQGAEQLLGQGDMLYMQGGGRIGRVHGPFVSDKEVEDVVAFLREQGEPAYLDEVTEAPDEDSGPALSGIAGASDGEKGLFDQAVDVVSREGKASTSFIQRHLSIGYNRAAKLIEQMEREGIISAANHVGKREVLVRRTNDD